MRVTRTIKFGATRCTKAVTKIINLTVDRQMHLFRLTAENSVGGVTRTVNPGMGYSSLRLWMSRGEGYLVWALKLKKIKWELKNLM